MIEPVSRQPTVSTEETQSSFDAADAFEAKHRRPIAPTETREALVKKAKPAPAQRGDAAEACAAPRRLTAHARRIALLQLFSHRPASPGDAARWLRPCPSPRTFKTPSASASRARRTEALSGEPIKRSATTHAQAPLPGTNWHHDTPRPSPISTTHQRPARRPHNPLPPPRDGVQQAANRGHPRRQPAWITPPVLIHLRLRPAPRPHPLQRPPDRPPHRAPALRRIPAGEGRRRREDRRDRPRHLDHQGTWTWEHGGPH